eukprot:122508-Chlamydomonas_euryale.AAC.1
MRALLICAGRSWPRAAQQPAPRQPTAGAPPSVGPLEAEPLPASAMRSRRARRRRRWWRSTGKASPATRGEGRRQQRLAGSQPEQPCSKGSSGYPARMRQPRRPVRAAVRRGARVVHGRVPGPSMQRRARCHAVVLSGNDDARFAPLKQLGENEQLVWIMATRYLPHPDKVSAGLRRHGAAAAAILGLAYCEGGTEADSRGARGSIRGRSPCRRCPRRHSRSRSSSSRCILCTRCARRVRWGRLRRGNETPPHPPRPTSLLPPVPCRHVAAH